VLHKVAKNCHFSAGVQQHFLMPVLRSEKGHYLYLKGDHQINNPSSIKDSPCYAIICSERHEFPFCIVHLSLILPEQAIPIHLAMRHLLKTAQPKASPRPAAFQERG